MPLGNHLLCVKTAMLFAGFKCTTACVRVLLSAVAVTSLALTPSDFVDVLKLENSPALCPIFIFRSMTQTGGRSPGELLDL